MKKDLVLSAKKSQTHQHGAIKIHDLLFVDSSAFVLLISKKFF